MTPLLIRGSDSKTPRDNDGHTTWPGNYGAWQACSVWQNHCHERFELFSDGKLCLWYYPARLPGSYDVDMLARRQERQGGVAGWPSISHVSMDQSSLGCIAVRFMHFLRV